MENELRENLLCCARAYAETRKLQLSTLGRLAVNDARFFTNLEGTATTFTARKYDEVIRWFSAQWPSDQEWPHGIERPQPAESAQ
jgi:hypothetical protein